jgi:hypothetical protein
MKNRRIARTIAATGLALAFAAAPPPNPPNQSPRARLSAPDPHQRAALVDAYGRLPLRFEENRGQARRGVQFLSRGAAQQILLTAEGARVSFDTEPDELRDRASRRERPGREAARHEAPSHPAARSASSGEV